MRRTVSPNATTAPIEWPEESASDAVDGHGVAQLPPHAFAVLIGACVYRVAGDGSVMLVMLEAGMVEYLRTGVHPRHR